MLPSDVPAGGQQWRGTTVPTGQARGKIGYPSRDRCNVIVPMAGQCRNGLIHWELVVHSISRPVSPTSPEKVVMQKYSVRETPSQNSTFSSPSASLRDFDLGSKYGFSPMLTTRFPWRNSFP